MLKAETIRRGLPLSWENALKVAAGCLTMDQALDVELAEQFPATQKYAIIGVAAISKIYRSLTSEERAWAKQAKNENIFRLSQAGHQKPAPEAGFYLN